MKKFLLLLSMLLVCSGCCDYCLRPAHHVESQYRLDRDSKELVSRKRWCQRHWTVRHKYRDIDNGGYFGYFLESN